MKGLAVIFIFLWAQASLADSWLCKEAASTRQGSTILACGVGTGPSLDQARSASLSNARHEFESICQPSSDCRDFDVDLRPLRTDCEKGHDGQTTCYRAVEYTITSRRKRDVTVDIQTVQEEIDAKKSELRQLHDQLAKQVELERVKKETDEAHEALEASVAVDKKELELDHLNEEVSSKAVESREYGYTNLNRPWTLGVGVSAEAIPRFGDMSTLFGVSLSVERRFLDMFGVRIRGTAVSDLYQKPSSNDTSTGPANGSQVFRGPAFGGEYDIALPVYIRHRYYLKPEIGLINVSRTDQTVSYGPLGSKTASQDLSSSWSSAYYGLGFGYSSGEIDERGRKWFIEVEAKGYSGSSNVGVRLVTGLIFSF